MLHSEADWGVIFYFFEGKNLLYKLSEIPLHKKFGYGTSLASFLKNLLNKKPGRHLFYSLSYKIFVIVSIVTLIGSGIS